MMIADGLAHARDADRVLYVHSTDGGFVWRLEDVETGATLDLGPARWTPESTSGACEEVGADQPGAMNLDEAIAAASP